MERENDGVPESPGTTASRSEYPPYLAWFLLSSFTFGLWIFPWLPFISSLHWPAKLLLMALFAYLTLTSYARSRWLSLFAAQTPVVLWWWANRVPIFKLALLKLLTDALWHHFPDQVRDYGHIPLISVPLGFIMAEVYPGGPREVCEAIWKRWQEGIDCKSIFWEGRFLGWPNRVLVLLALGVFLVPGRRKDDYGRGYILLLAWSYSWPTSIRFVQGVAWALWHRVFSVVVYVGGKFALLVQTLWSILVFRAIVWVLGVLVLTYYYWIFLRMAQRRIRGIGSGGDDSSSEEEGDDDDDGDDGDEDDSDYGGDENDGDGGDGGDGGGGDGGDGNDGNDGNGGDGGDGDGGDDGDGGYDGNEGDNWGDGGDGDDGSDGENENGEDKDDEELEEEKQEEEKQEEAEQGEEEQEEEDDEGQEEEEQEKGQEEEGEEEREEEDWEEEGEEEQEEEEQEEEEQEEEDEEEQEEEEEEQEEEDQEEEEEEGSSPIWTPTPKFPPVKYPPGKIPLVSHPPYKIPPVKIPPFKKAPIGTPTPKGPRIKPLRFKSTPVIEGLRGHYPRKKGTRHESGPPGGKTSTKNPPIDIPPFKIPEVKTIKNPEVIKSQPSPPDKDDWTDWLWEWTFEIIGGVKTKKKSKQKKKKKKKKKGGPPGGYKKPPGPPGGDGGPKTPKRKGERTHPMTLRASSVPVGGYSPRWPRWISASGDIIQKAIFNFAIKAMLFLFPGRADRLVEWELEDKPEYESVYEYEYADGYDHAWDEDDALEWDGEFKSGEFGTEWDDEDIRGYDFFATDRDDFIFMPRRKLRRSLLASPTKPRPPPPGSREEFTPTTTRTREFTYLSPSQSLPRSVPKPSATQLPLLTSTRPQRVSTLLQQPLTQTSTSKPVFPKLPPLRGSPPLPPPTPLKTTSPGRPKPKTTAQPKPKSKPRAPRSKPRKPIAEPKPFTPILGEAVTRWFASWWFVAMALIIIFLLMVERQREEWYTGVREAGDMDWRGGLKRGAERVRFDEYGVV